jgi:hypothetical protein
LPANNELFFSFIFPTKFVQFYFIQNLYDLCVCAACTEVDYQLPGPSSTPEIWAANVTSSPVMPDVVQRQTSASNAAASFDYSPASPVSFLYKLGVASFVSS